MTAASDEPGPSFDCAKATSAFEHAICDDPQLSAADALMAQLYAASKVSAFGSGPSNELAVQRAWLKARDDSCDFAKSPEDRLACRRSVYDRRNRDLATAAVFARPALALDTLRGIEPETAALVEAVYLYSGEPRSADWHSPALAPKRQRIARLLEPQFNNLATTDRSNFGREILSSLGIDSFRDVMASEANFATFLNIDSAYLDGGPAVIPCEALVKHPALMGAVDPIFGSTLDSVALRSDCTAMLPPTPRLDRLIDAIEDAWPPCSGSIRFATYRGFAADIDRARLGIASSEKPAASLPRRKDIASGLATAAVAELAQYYRRYQRAPAGETHALAIERVGKLMRYDGCGPSS